MTNYRIVLSYACFSITVNNSGIVTDTAPIGKWMIGKHIEFIKKWIFKKNGEIDTY